MPIRPRLQEPPWWYGPRWPLLAVALQPAGYLYGRAAIARFARATPYRSRLPVICIGNLVAGGTGKTPLALYLAALLAARGASPVFLSRGYGGRIAGPHLVDAVTDRAPDVGDEPLLLAQAAPTVIARDRAQGARLIETLPATHILMDDGLQNPALHKDLVLAVIDGERWVGNGQVIPAGPLRAPLTFQAELVDALVISGIGPAAAPVPRALAAHFDVPVIQVSRRPTGVPDGMRERPWVAYAGIGRPDAFFAMLEAHGARLAQRVAYTDHHAFTQQDARTLLTAAQAHGAGLVTTQKDGVRLQGGDGDLGRLHAQSRTVGLALVLAAADQARLAALLDRLPAPRSTP